MKNKKTYIIATIIALAILLICIYQDKNTVVLEHTKNFEESRVLDDEFYESNNITGSDIYSNIAFTNLNRFKDYTISLYLYNKEERITIGTIDIDSSQHSGNIELRAKGIVNILDDELGVKLAVAAPNKVILEKTISDTNINNNFKNYSRGYHNIDINLGDEVLLAQLSNKDEDPIQNINNGLIEHQRGTIGIYASISEK